MALRKLHVPFKPAADERRAGSKNPSSVNAPRHGAPADTAAQDWLPLQDLHDGCLIRPDGAVVAGIQIAPYSLSLKSAREQSQAIAGLWAALNGLTVPWQWLSMYRPVDLDHYLTTLDAQLATTDGRRRMVLRDYIHWVSQMVRAGETVERKYYLLCTRTGPDAVSEHHTALRTLETNLGRIRGLQATMMDDAAWRELLFLTFHASQAAAESVPDGFSRLAPLYYSHPAEEV
uniref:TraC-like domain-containing protein n=1 Tax=Sulfobacillus thermotolerans TaxID=338644 RepID=G5CJ78_9FIRM|nr:hypothetical protein [Sulfobacillus thermotolerans]AEP14355.1 conserved hypothetical protein [Sulfobacillus thermotolerans]